MGNEEIEKAILYYIIFEKIECNLTEKDFFSKLNKEIIRAINILKAQKEEISIITIKSKMNSNNKEIIKYLASLGDYIFLTSFETAYRILKEYTKKRQIIEISKNIPLELLSVEDINVYIEKLMAELKKIEFQTESEEDFSTQIIKTVTEIEEKMNKEQDYSLYTGIFDLDALTDGLHEGELTVIGARPRCWKNNICFADS